MIREAQGPVTPREIRIQVGARLEIDVSFDTVYGFLLLAIKSDKWAIERVGYGKYIAV